MTTNALAGEQSVREVERKFAVDNSFVLPDFTKSLRAIESVERRAPVTLEATYFDTKNFQLLRAGITLRRRIGGTDAGWHLKLPEQRFERRELQVLHPEIPTIPTELLEALRNRLHLHGRLRPVLQMRTQRTVSELLGNDRASLAEVADDHVLALDLQTASTSTWREIEIEKRTATEEMLNRLSEFLVLQGAREASYLSKLERGLAQAENRNARSLTHPIVVRLREQFAEMVIREVDVRLDADEGIHRMRVATRRLRSCLKTFRELFVKGSTLWLEQELQLVGNRLGAARDAEVIAKRVDDDLDAIPSDNILGPVRQALLLEQREDIQESRAALLQALDTQMFRELLEAFSAFVTNPSLRTPKVRLRSIRKPVLTTVRRTQKLVTRARRFEGQRRETEMHEVRKAAKHVRYAAESIAPLYQKRALKLASRFESVQEALGEYHDSLVVRQLFRDEGARAGVRRNENGFTYGILYAHEDQRAALALWNFERSWKEANRPAVYRWLKK